MNAAAKRSRKAASRSPGPGRPSGRASGRSTRLSGSKPAPWRPYYDQGFSDGYGAGVQEGIRSFGTLFEGTSIVIPTCNQLGVLKLCISSIMRHTGVPHEIIVTDNASTDGTEAYLRELAGRVRYRRLESNRGFAGAVNVGLMMARGTTIAVLNNDTIVTENWLSNMLACLNGDSRIGMVGPVTNIISNDEQRVPVSYRNTRELAVFAARNNRPDPARWAPADRLMGFCLLFRRETLEQVGYFDEGYKIGNFEDVDFNVRVQLLGKRLMIARDAYIHHFGSVSIRALGGRAAQITRLNEAYFREKWKDPGELIRAVHQHELFARHGGQLPDMRLLYPERVAVRGISPTVYWIEDGVRRPVNGVITFPPVRVSHLDLRRWPLAEPIDAHEAEVRWRGLTDEAGVAVARLPDGTFCHLEGGSFRRIVGTLALQAWNLHLKPSAVMTPEQLARRMEGLPIIAPVQCHSQL
ncbi:MAG: glycosyl transferase family 2 [Paenibacillaceae bacterium ZCTH02-B3]|nr:MAG: glycosyl transferase family 2 [Paenibacillaceae bacterium ZCTH02-B3]